MYRKQVDGLQLTPIVVRMLEGRVGSTLLMHLLGTSDDIVFDRTYPYENSYLTYLLRLADIIASEAATSLTLEEIVLYGPADEIGPIPFTPVMVDRADLSRRSLAALWAAFTEASATDGGPRYYAEKFWGDVGSLLAAGLSPMVINVVRDPRDVIASIRAFNLKTGEPRFGRRTSQDDEQHFEGLVAGMGFRFRELSSPVQAPHVTVRYEDLVADPAGTASELSTFLGVELRPSRLGTGDFGDRHMTSESVAASVGRWRRDLSQREIEYIERRLGSSMKLYGYASSTR